MIPINFMDRTPNLIMAKKEEYDHLNWKGEPRMGIWRLISNEINHEESIFPIRKLEIEYEGFEGLSMSEAINRLCTFLNGENERMNYPGVDYLKSGTYIAEYKLFKPKITKVIFNDPATIIIWKDGKKTVVKAGEGEKYDPEKGLAMAIAKYALGNEGNYYETFKKWLPEEEKEETITRSLNDVINDVKDDLNSMFSQFMNPPEEENNELD